jgi:hypothetical protein
MKTIIHIDASSLKQSGCILHFYRTVIEGYRSPVNSASIEFGTAFHLYRSTYVETGDQLVAITAASNYFKKTPMIYHRKNQYLNGGYLIDTCEAYEKAYAFDVYQPVKDPATGKPMVEVKFAYPYANYEDIEVVICGTIDNIVHNTVGDFYVIKDYKTHSGWEINGYLDGYALSSQLMFYNHALKSYARHFPSSIIAKICERPLGGIIDGIFLAANKTAVFERSTVFYFEDKMAQFEKGLAKAVASIVEAVRRPKESLYREGMMNGSCEKVWGKCPFFSVCSESREENQQLMLEQNFVVRKYNPLMFGKEQ